MQNNLQPDRPGFESSLDGAIAALPGSDAGIAIAVLDIDRLGEINREYGRSVGDALVHALGEALSAAFGDPHRVARIGGDAQALFSPGTEKETAFLAIEAFRADFAGERTVALGSSAIRLTVGVSGGLAAYPEDAANARDLLNKASGALYRAKVTGRNRICLAREEKMVTKTSHYPQGLLMGLRRLAEREGISDAVLLREALTNLLRKYNG